MIGRTLSGRRWWRDQPAVLKPTILTQPSSYEFAILKALQSKVLYQGTVPAAVKASRRARDKVAKASRKVNRGC